MVDALPDAPIVHIVRDGRDCANSLVESYDVLSDEKLTHLKGSEMRLGRPYDERFVPWWVEEGRGRVHQQSALRASYLDVEGDGWPLSRGVRSKGWAHDSPGDGASV